MLFLNASELLLFASELLTAFLSIELILLPELLVAAFLEPVLTGFFLIVLVLLLFCLAEEDDELFLAFLRFVIDLIMLLSDDLDLTAEDLLLSDTEDFLAEDRGMTVFVAFAEDDLDFDAFEDLPEVDFFWVLSSVFAFVDFLPADFLEVCAKLAVANISKTDRAIYFFITFSFNY